jgi:hypothetical protein
MDDPAGDQEPLGQNNRPSANRVRAFGCFVLVGLPLAIVICCGGACAAIGEVNSEREIAFYAFALLGIGIATLIATVYIAAWFFIRRD